MRWSYEALILAHLENKFLKISNKVSKDKQDIKIKPKSNWNSMK